MKSINLLIIFILFFQFNSSAIARDDLIVNKEISVLQNFSDKNGYGVCFEAVARVQSLAKNFVNACESLGTKSAKAVRHCSTASDTAYCLENILDNKPEKVLSLIRCCGFAKEAGKMR
jgi:hypothetical protein